MHATVVIEAKYVQTQAAMVLYLSDCDFRQSITLDASIGSCTSCSTDVSKVLFNCSARTLRGHPLSVRAKAIITAAVLLAALRCELIMLDLVFDFIDAIPSPSLSLPLTRSTTMPLTPEALCR